MVASALHGNESDRPESIADPRGGGDVSCPRPTGKDIFDGLRVDLVALLHEPVPERVALAFLTADQQGRFTSLCEQHNLNWSSVVGGEGGRSPAVTELRQLVDTAYGELSDAWARHVECSGATSKVLDSVRISGVQSGILVPLLDRYAELEPSIVRELWGAVLDDHSSVVGAVGRHISLATSLGAQEVWLEEIRRHCTQEYPTELGALLVRDWSKIAELLEPPRLSRLEGILDDFRPSAWLEHPTFLAGCQPSRVTRAMKGLLNQPERFCQQALEILTVDSCLPETRSVLRNQVEDLLKERPQLCSLPILRELVPQERIEEIVVKALQSAPSSELLCSLVVEQTLSDDPWRGLGAVQRMVEEQFARFPSLVIRALERGVCADAIPGFSDRDVLKSVAEYPFVSRIGLISADASLLSVLRTCGEDTRNSWYRKIAALRSSYAVEQVMSAVDYFDPVMGVEFLREVEKSFQGALVTHRASTTEELYEGLRGKDLLFVWNTIPELQRQELVSQYPEVLDRLTLRLSCITRQDESEYHDNLQGIRDEHIKMVGTSNWSQFSSLVLGDGAAPLPWSSLTNHPIVWALCDRCVVNKHLSKTQNSWALLPLELREAIAAAHIFDSLELTSEDRAELLKRSPGSIKETMTVFRVAVERGVFNLRGPASLSAREQEALGGLHGALAQSCPAGEDISFVDRLSPLDVVRMLELFSRADVYEPDLKRMVCRRLGSHSEQAESLAEVSAWRGSESACAWAVRMGARWSSPRTVNKDLSVKNPAQSRPIVRLLCEQVGVVRPVHENTYSLSQKYDQIREPLRFLKGDPGSEVSIETRRDTYAALSTEICEARAELLWAALAEQRIDPVTLKVSVGNHSWSLAQAVREIARANSFNREGEQEVLRAFEALAENTSVTLADVRVADDVSVMEALSISRTPVVTCAEQDSVSTPELAFGLALSNTHRIAVIRGTQGQIVARCVAMLGHASGGERHLILQRVYPEETPAELVEAFIEWGRVKSDHLGVTLSITDQIRESLKGTESSYDDLVLKTPVRVEVGVSATTLYVDGLRDQVSLDEILKPVLKE